MSDFKDYMEGGIFYDEYYTELDIVCQIVENKAIEDVRQSQNLSDDQEVNLEQYKQDYLAFADKRARELTYKYFAEQSKNNDQVNTTDLVECYEGVMHALERELEGPIDYDDDDEDLPF